MKATAKWALGIPVMTFGALVLGSSQAQAGGFFTFNNATFSDTSGQNQGTGVFNGSFIVPDVWSTITQANRTTPPFVTSSPSTNPQPANLTTTFTWTPNTTPSNNSSFNKYPITSNPSVQTLFYNRVFLNQSSYNGTSTKLIFTCVGGTAAGCTPNSEIANQNPSGYQLIIDIAGNLVQAPPSNVILSASNLGNTNQICSDFTNLAENSCGQGETSRIEVSSLTGNLVLVPAPIPLLGFCGAFLSSRRLRNRIRKSRVS